MTLPKAPNSRAEQYLAKIAGQETELPEGPQSRVEQYLEYIAENGTVSKEEIAEQVSAWLEENIHEDPTVVIDASLSVSGAAADAKATGDEIADLKADLSESVSDLKSAIFNETPVTLTLEQQKRYDVENGVLNVLTGSNYNSYKSAIIAVNPGETYLYSGRVYNYANQYSLIAIDSDNTPLKYELNNTSDTTVTDYSFTIPADASQLIIQSYVTTPTLNLYENTISDLTTKTEALRSDVDEITIDARAQEYNNVMRSISRLGLSSVAPHNSRAAFLAAYKYGFRILLCDLRFTSDGVPVLFHDRYINQNYRNVYYTGGGMVSRDSQITIESLTAAQVQELEYRKTIDGVLTSFPIMFLDDMCLLVKQLGTELYLECKTALTAAQAETACNIVLKYGIAEKTSWTADNASYLTEVVAKISSARVATMPSTINASQVNALKTLLTGQNEVFMFSWNTVTLTETIISLLTADNIPLEIGTMDGDDTILNYLAQGAPYLYVSGIESNATIAGKVILENTLS